MERTGQHLSDLLHAAAKGDEAAWEQLVDRFGGLLWAITRAHRLDHADAADVVQVTWLRLLQHCGSIRDPERLGAWLATTTRRECLRVIRGAERVHPVADPPEPEPLPQLDSIPEVAVIASEREALLHRAIGELSPRCQRLLGALMSVDSPSYADVSHALDLP
ncbi:MAG: RNA polymerase sigma factor, partial [Egibacteraceae bacterium]